MTMTSDTTTTDVRTRNHTLIAARAVAGLLGNTPAVCRKSYIHPRIFELYETGKIRKALPGSETQGFERAVIKHIAAA